VTRHYLSNGKIRKEVTMSRAKNILRVVLIAIAGVWMAGFKNCSPDTAPPLNPLTLLPTDASPTCTVPSATFNTWFVKTPITANGAVNPANSVTFPNTPNCSFYQWAMQDFLWLTSPTTSLYGGNGLILDSPAFFDVSPPSGSESGSRTLLPHTSGFLHPLALRAAQAGPGGLQVTFDSAGTPIEVKPAAADAILTVLNAAGARVQVAHAKLGRDRKPILLDTNGNTIQALPAQGVKPQIRAESVNAKIPTMVVATRFIIDGIPIFVDPSLAVIDVEQGEADTNGVLEAQIASNGSLIYYATIVNDVYAYYATGVADHAISLTGDGICTPGGTPCFPTTQSQLNQIVSFATGHATFPDANALAVEVKSAWVVAAGLPNLSSYITMNATIPTYNPPVPPPAGTTTLTQTGQQTVQLALVGMHVVGSAAGHPEMIWATFEHVNNVPAGTYSYINTSNSTASVNQNIAENPTIAGSVAAWLFTSTSPAGFNKQNMSANSFTSPATITANGGGTISPSDTIRWKALGSASDITPNPIDASTAASNTEIIAINNSIQSMLASGDVRANYILTGATWTANGGAPIGSGSSIASCANIHTVTTGCPVGTSALSNSTMETYDQGQDNTLANGGSNCLTCHSGGNTTVVSHVFGELKPLF
jgi:hypothetical protein